MGTQEIVIVVVAVAAIAGILLVLIFLNYLGRVPDTKKVDSGGGKSDAAKSDGQSDVGDAVSVPDAGISLTDDSPLATEIESLITVDSSKREVVAESASQRSRMHSRRARMLEYYDKKYKSRTVMFDANSFEDPIDTSAVLNVDGVEITREDVKKLTALNDLLKRKTGDT